MNRETWRLCMMGKILRVGPVDGIAVSGRADSSVPPLFWLSYPQHTL